MAQAILYREMYRDGSLESQLVTGSNAFLAPPEDGGHAPPTSSSSKRRWIGRSRSRRQRLERNPRDVQALYAAAVAHGLRANFLYLVEKSWMQSLHEAVAARKANDQILSIDPGFIDAHLLHGLNEYVVGCLPAYLRSGRRGQRLSWR